MSQNKPLFYQYAEKKQMLPIPWQQALNQWNQIITNAPHPNKHEI